MTIFRDHRNEETGSQGHFSSSQCRKHYSATGTVKTLKTHITLIVAFKKSVWGVGVWGDAEHKALSVDLMEDKQHSHTHQHNTNTELQSLLSRVPKLYSPSEPQHNTTALTRVLVNLIVPLMKKKTIIIISTANNFNMLVLLLRDSRNTHPIHSNTCGNSTLTKQTGLPTQPTVPETMRFWPRVANTCYIRGTIAS